MKEKKARWRIAQRRATFIHKSMGISDFTIRDLIFFNDRVNPPESGIDFFLLNEEENFYQFLIFSFI